jgi:hypothetical protein
MGCPASGNKAPNRLRKTVFVARADAAASEPNLIDKIQLGRHEDQKCTEANEHSAQDWDNPMSNFVGAPSLPEKADGNNGR